MSRKPGPTFVGREAGAHAAALAMSRCLPDLPAPDRVEAVKQRNARGVYRLSGPSGYAIVAKHGQAARIGRERYIYEEALPACGATGLRFLGEVPGDRGRSWLFIEAARGVPFDRTNAAHTRLAARWFSKLHIHTWPAVAGRMLPEKDVGRYRESIEKTMARLRQVRTSNTDLPSGGVAAISAVEARLQRLWRSWPAFEEACPSEIRTLVHGDVQPKNMMVSPEGALAVFDWELSGFGSPLHDLSTCLDLDAYLESARERWPWLTRPSLHRMARAGLALRWVEAVHWDSIRLASPWWSRALRHMEGYAKAMHEVDLSWLGASWQKETA